MKNIPFHTAHVAFALMLIAVLSVTLYALEPDGGKTGEGGGPTLWVKSTPPCSRSVTTFRTVWTLAGPTVVVSTTIYNGNMTTCTAGGNQQCTDAPCNA